MAPAETDSGLDHPSFLAAGGTLAAYAIVILAMTAILFGIPYLLFVLF
ncbi:hypothetical protein KM295_03665 [Natronomonas sp. F2-12]|jgi:hypothetical protein|uniref:Uncharacterized protein n=1 Tax=Natronomonas aquatica TaxID=2841590 RepID=A0A9R1CRH6_9EURY|nr:hypothetical protein [Natronomonas aquatica]MCQ4332600.1 hypothetical protein [Natronomonas aquatica]